MCIIKEHVIETTSLSKRYGTQDVIYNVNICVPKGKIYGLLGRNGAGKTTTIRMLMCLCRPTSGTIRLFGKNIQTSPQDIYRRVGSIIETPGFYSNLTAQENLSILMRMRKNGDKKALGHALEIVNLENEKKTFGKFSLGMKQRLGIAAIMHKPELLILDEPTNGLDPVGVANVRKLLKSLCAENGTTILISSHILGEIEQIADVIGLVHNCGVTEYEMSDLRNKTEGSLEDWFIKMTGGVGIA